IVRIMSTAPRSQERFLDWNLVLKLNGEQTKIKTFNRCRNKSFSTVASEQHRGPSPVRGIVGQALTRITRDGERDRFADMSCLHLNVPSRCIKPRPPR